MLYEFMFSFDFVPYFVAFAKELKGFRKILIFSMGSFNIGDQVLVFFQENQEITNWLDQII